MIAVIISIELISFFERFFVLIEFVCPDRIISVTSFERFILELEANNLWRHIFSGAHVLWRHIFSGGG